ncbi:MAG: hypothetical protein QM488_05990 [Rhizobiaceae bacterium]
MVDTIDKLRITLSEFDGHAITLLSEAGAKYSDRTDYLDSLVALSSEGGKGVSNGATWLLKSYLDDGGGMSGEQVSHLLSQVDGIQNWAAQLHLCQSIQYLTVSSADADHLIYWLQPLLDHERPFLRAWSLDAIFRVSSQYSRFDNMLEMALSSGAKDPAASVRAKVRSLKK